MSSMPPPRASNRIAWATVPSIVTGVGALAWRLRIERPHGFPAPPFVIASNHHSFLDPLLLGTAWGSRMRFIGLVDLFGNHPLLDFALEAFETIPVRRGVVPLGPVRAALGHLEAGGVVGLFPEGRRHWAFDPASALPGAAWLAARVGVPLVPAAIAGSEDVLGVDNRLHRGRIRVVVGPALAAEGSDRPAVDHLTRRWAHWVAETLSP
jgi:1-acyl-sn-glycerol-3-phosphate acyltransferase